jgi:hypothetical protein
MPYESARARQRNQENSEEATMSVFRADVAALRVHEANDREEASHHSGVMDDTPPHSRTVDRYLADS